MLDVGKRVGDFFRITEKRNYPVCSKLSPKVDSFLSGFSPLINTECTEEFTRKTGRRKCVLSESRKWGLIVVETS